MMTMKIIDIFNHQIHIYNGLLRVIPAVEANAKILGQIESQLELLKFESQLELLK